MITNDNDPDNFDTASNAIDNARTLVDVLGDTEYGSGRIGSMLCILEHLLKTAADNLNTMEKMWRLEAQQEEAARREKREVAMVANRIVRRRKKSK